VGSAPLPLLPTTVIGPYSVPDWLERLKTDYHRGRLSGTQLESVHEVAIKAAIKDQEIAGIDIVTTASYGSRRELVLALARVLHGEAAGLAAAGATMIQIDEPFLAGYPDDVDLAIEAINVVTEDVDAEWGLHVCYGNRYARPSWEGHYDFLFPAVLDANVDQLLLEFARKGYQDLEVVARGGWDRKLGLGVVDVKSRRVEPPELIGSRIRRAADVLGAENLIVNPDCGLRHLPADIARAKLGGMVEASAALRAELLLDAPASVPRAAPASVPP